MQTEDVIKIKLKNENIQLKEELRVLKERLHTTEMVLKSEKSMNDTLKECNIKAFTQVDDLAKMNDELYTRLSRSKHAYNVLLNEFEKIQENK